MCTGGCMCVVWSVYASPKGQWCFRMATLDGDFGWGFRAGISDGDFGWWLMIVHMTPAMPDLSAQWTATPETHIVTLEQLSSTDRELVLDPDHHATEWVILSDLAGNPTGIANKATVHDAHTPLHHAFSCYVRDPEGNVLLTRRALNKIAWPGVWTNAFCGHPAVGETYRDTIVRRGERELGIPAEALAHISVMVSDFWYHATDSSGVVEFEVCPVFMATVSSRDVINPAADEVDSFQWIGAKELIIAVDAAPFAFSPWMVSQLQNPALRQTLLEQ